MDEIQVGNQVIRFEWNLTKAAYRAVPGGDAERCGCLYCLNFAAQRSSRYPDEFITRLHEIDIDPGKEGEVDELSAEGDRRIYGGWFYFVGEVVEAGERSPTPASFDFWFADAKGLPKPVPDFGDNVAAVEFMTRLPWVLSEQPEPES